MPLPRRLLVLVAGACLSLTLAGRGWGQSFTHGSLEGVVRDSSGAALAETSVTLQDLDSGLSQTVTTPRSGRFGFALLPPGDYRLMVERYGYRPQRMTDIPVRPGQHVELGVSLKPATQAASVETVRFPALALAASPIGIGEWFSSLELAGLAEEGRTLRQVGRLSSLTNGELEGQGLPASLTGVLVDAFPVAPARHPWRGTGSLGGAHLPLGAFGQAALFTQSADVEWSALGGSLLSAYTRRGSREVAVEAFGNWSALSAGGGVGEAGGFQGGARVSGPLIRDTASFVVGIEAWRRDSPALRPLAADLAAGADAGPALRSDAVTGYGRLDWNFGANHALSLRATFGAVPTGHEPAGSTVASAVGSAFDGTELFSGGTLTSRLASTLSQEVRLGFQSSSRSYSAAPGTGGALGQALGGRFDQWSVYGAEVLHLRAAAHRLKGGITASLRSYEYDSRDPGLTGLAGGDGTAAGSEAAFVVPHFAGFVQDNWRAAPGLDLLFGVRFDSERLPREEVMPSAEWFRRTGVVSNEFEEGTARWSPRLGFLWDVQQRHRLTLYGAGGMYAGSTEPGLFSEAVTHDGSLYDRDESRADSSGTQLLRPVYTFLSPGFEAPYSTRGSLGATLSLGGGAAVRVATSYRRTDSLPRRTDVNLLPAPVARDPFGRPVYGRLRRDGERVFADPGSNRRFDEFAGVGVLSSDGWSSYRSLTASLERRGGPGGLQLLASYTFSDTRDNWLAARDGRGDAALSPFPEETGDDWREGRSDFDVPHRLVVGAETALPGLGAVRLATLYRLESGPPFTPGFRPGVDANGDGSSLNDPAFVDPGVAGMDAVLGAWECLREQASRFADRNSCRGETVHALDARLALRLVRGGRYALELVADGLNLTGRAIRYPDGALYLVDPAGSLARGAGTVTLPLLANPNFGRPLADAAPGRILRLGFRISY